MFDVFVDMVLSHHSKKDKVIFGIFEIGKLRHTHKTRAQQMYIAHQVSNDAYIRRQTGNVITHLWFLDS